MFNQFRGRKHIISESLLFSEDDLVMHVYKQTVSEGTMVDLRQFTVEVIVCVLCLWGFELETKLHIYKTGLFAACNIKQILNQR